MLNTILVIKHRCQVSLLLSFLFWNREVTLKYDQGHNEGFVRRVNSESAPPPIWGTFSTWDPKNGSQPQNSPRLRYYNTKRTQKLCETCRNWHLSVSWILPSFCSRQGPPLWNWANFDHFCPLPARPNVIWLQKVVSYTPFTYLGKVKKNWQLFPLIFLGELQKYDRGGGFRSRT